MFSLPPYAVALHHQRRRAPRAARIDSHSALAHAPRVRGVVAVRVAARCRDRSTDRRRGRSVRLPIAPPYRAPAKSFGDEPPPASAYNAARFAGLLGDDVDDTVHRVRAPHRATGAADDFNAIDIFEEHILDVPEHAGEERRVHAAAIDEHEQLVRRGAVESARRDRPLMRADLRDLEIRREPQRLRNARRAGAADLVVRDDLNRGCDLRELLRLSGDGRHVDLEQLFQAQALELTRRRDRVLRLRGRAARPEG